MATVVDPPDATPKFMYEQLMVKRRDYDPSAVTGKGVAIHLAA